MELLGQTTSQHCWNDNAVSSADTSPLEVQVCPLTVLSCVRVSHKHLLSPIFRGQDSTATAAGIVGSAQTCGSVWSHTMSQPCRPCRRPRSPGQPVGLRGCRVQAVLTCESGAACLPLCNDQWQGNTGCVFPHFVLLSMPFAETYQAPQASWALFQLLGYSS